MDDHQAATISTTYKCKYNMGISKYCMRHQPAAGPGTKSMRLYRIVSDRIVCTMPPPSRWNWMHQTGVFVSPRAVAQVRSVSLRNGLGWSRMLGRFPPALSQVPFFSDSCVIPNTLSHSTRPHNHRFLPCRAAAAQLPLCL
ncbi:hypothetical protein B0H65DRAFT_110059 [Neurospora tetraspora]|uniref:Uncharacterized protein n=1 Tax=Neurospora tetraspora TaxID=94610 RepID=A0AAE0MUX4_9PEZI|nr:hypothetical protein B0H65DRAFT_110059 [Neurospora tetraspora]